MQIRRATDGTLPGFLRSSTFRLSLFYVLLFFVSVILLLAFIYLQTSAAIDRDTEQEIKADAAGLSQQYAAQGIAGLIEAVEERVDQPERAGEGLYLLIDDEGAPLAGNIRKWPDVEPDKRGSIEFAVSRGSESHEARAMTYAFPDGSKLLVGRDLRALFDFKDVMVDAVLSSLAITLVLGIGGGLLISRRMLKRLETINRSAERVMAGELSHRISTSGANDEFDRLSDTLNAMLEEIRRLMASMRTVIDNVAHDLRSPISRMRGRLEMALSDPGSERAAIERTIADADQLLGTFNALLSIADAESGNARASMMPLDLAALATDIEELYAPAAEERGIAMSASIVPAVVTGSRQLLFQALSNLVDNAVKHTPPGGMISLEVKNDGQGPVLIVADTGPGIPEAARETVTEPFVRLDSSRSTPGNGLGLALVAAIARLHGARLILGDNAPGLSAALVFPSVPQSLAIKNL